MFCDVCTGLSIVGNHSWTRVCECAFTRWTWLNLLQVSNKSCSWVVSVSDYTHITKIVSGYVKVFDGVGSTHSRVYRDWTVLPSLVQHDIPWINLLWMDACFIDRVDTVVEKFLWPFFLCCLILVNTKNCSIFHWLNIGIIFLKYVRFLLYVSR